MIMFKISHPASLTIFNPSDRFALKEEIDGRARGVDIRLVRNGRIRSIFGLGRFESGDSAFSGHAELRDLGAGREARNQREGETRCGRSIVIIINVEQNVRRFHVCMADTLSLQVGQDAITKNYSNKEKALDNS